MSAGEKARPASPPASGRDSPAPQSVRRIAGEEDDAKRNDKSYRRYASGIERALALIDSAPLEWPDYISFLGRLLKAIQAHPAQVDSLPHKSAVAHRLSQCLTPALPSGVHQKALEVYEYIFELIGTEGLGHDLAVFLPGLSSVLSFASLSLHPVFLDIFQQRVLSLSPQALRPALRALILCLLPGLEDESSEEFERTITIVDGLRRASIIQDTDIEANGSAGSDEFFWQCMFLATIGSRSRRPGALAYLARRLPRLISSNGSASARLDPSAQSVVSPEPGLLIRCFAVGLRDDQPLIQRGFLDLLLTHLPLNSPVLASMVSGSDLETLVIAAVGVVARRDMSLNRRLWAWFLGPQSTDEDEDITSASSPVEVSKVAAKSPSAEYFEAYGLKPLTDGLLTMFNASIGTPLETARPYRICLSLLDRSEIGIPLVARVFVPAMHNVYKYQQAAPESDAQEVLRSANSFFDGIESGIIWGELLRLIKHTFSPQRQRGGKEPVETLSLIKYILSSFNVREEEMLIFHMPLACLSISTLINEVLASDRNGLDDDFLQEALLVTDRMVSYLPERAKLNDSFASTDPGATTGEQIRTAIAKFYEDSQGNVAISPPPFSSRQTASLLLRESAASFRLGLLAQIPSIELVTRSFSSLVHKIPRDEPVDFDALIATSQKILHEGETSDRQIDFTTLGSIVQVFTQIAATRELFFASTETTLHPLLVSLVRQFWAYLTPTHPRHHVEAVRALWHIDEIATGARLVEASVANFLVKVDELGLGRTEQARRFAVFWTHATHAASNNRKGSVKTLVQHSPSDQALPNKEWYHTLHRPLCLLLDGLVEHDTEMKYFLTSWLTSLPNIEIILDMIFHTELEYVRRLRTQLRSVAGDSAGRLQALHHDTTPQCLYFMRHMQNLLKLGSSNVWTAMSRINSPGDSFEDGDISTNASTFDSYVALHCLRILRLRPIATDSNPTRNDITLQCTCLSIIQQLMRNPNPAAIQKLNLEIPFIDTLREYLARGTKEPSLQIALLDTIHTSLKLKAPDRTGAPPLQSPSLPGYDSAKQVSRSSLTDDSLQSQMSSKFIQPPKQLVNCIQEGISMASSFYVLEHWIHFLIDVLPLFAGNLFQNLIPLVECICRQINMTFSQLQSAFRKNSTESAVPPDSSLLALLEGLEHVLAISHDQLDVEEAKAQQQKSPEPSQGFFGNVVSGVFTSEAAKPGRATANTRLTVLLCFQDAVRICLSIWSWGTYSEDKASKTPTFAASFSYSSTRLRNRARRILDRMFGVEPLECLETIIAAWCRPESRQPGLSALNLLHVLDASQPKTTMPAIFNAIYSRTNPGALETNRVSSLSSEISVFELGRFLLDYTQSLDDDAMDEVWNDCMTFLRDVLSNPLPHSHVLPCLLIFLITLAEKVENTNFGEQRKIRKDLSDLFMKVLAALVTTRSAASFFDPALAVIENASSSNGSSTSQRASASNKPRTIDCVEMLSLVVPKLDAILSEPEKQLASAASISSHAIAPSIQSKGFPESLKPSQLELLQKLSRVPSTAKVWRKDVADMFNHPKFFSFPSTMLRTGLLPVLQSWTLVDKDRIPDLIARITAPTSAGIMFGVGASAARLDADKRTQLALRRIALLLLSARQDAALTHYPILEEKLTELLNATPSSSPSSNTRAEVFMVLQAIVLRTSTIHLASLWPMIRLELQRAIGSTLPRGAEYEVYNVPALLQACKLLDLLLTASPDDFQLHQWLFICDTIDAVYRPVDFEPVGLVDDIAEELGTTGNSASSPLAQAQTPALDSGPIGLNGSDKRDKKKTCLLKVPENLDSTNLSKDEFVGRIIKPFFGELSIHAYESAYGLGSIDWDEWERSLIADLFAGGTLVG